MDKPEEYTYEDAVKDIAEKLSEIEDNMVVFGAEKQPHKISKELFEDDCISKSIEKEIKNSL